MSRGAARISVDEAARLWTEASDDELRRARPRCPGPVARARPGDLHGDADHQLHERLRCPVRLLRLLRAPRAGRRVRTRSRRGVREDRRAFSRSAAISSRSTAASIRNYRSTTTATCSRPFESAIEDRIEFYALTVAEFMFLADRADLSYAETAGRLRDAGVYWVTGGGSEILTEDFRKRHAKFKYTVAEYFEAQRAIVESGLRTTATMVIGFDETLDERLEHLQRTRDFQDGCLRDGLPGLFSLLSWTYKPYGTALGGREIEPREYWRHIALSRIFLDNIEHIRTSVLTLNEDAFRALDYGADDFDLPIEDEVTQKAGATIDLDLERSARRFLAGSATSVEYRRAERPCRIQRRLSGASHNVIRFGPRPRERALRAPPGAGRRPGSPSPAARSRARPRSNGRGRRSRPRGRARPRAGRLRSRHARSRLPAPR